MKNRFPKGDGERSRRQVAPELNLWNAVLRRAIQDSIFFHDGCESTRERIRALRWINSDSNEDGSFLWVCDHLELEYESVRVLVNNGKPGDYYEFMSRVR